MTPDRSKAWQYFFMSAWPSLAASALFTAAKVDWRIVVISLGNAIYQGIVSNKALKSNPNKPNGVDK